MIDTHAHLNFPELGKDLPGVLERAKAAGVSRIIVPSTNAESSTSSVNISEPYDYIFSAVGVHPLDAHNYTDADRNTIDALLDGTNSIVSIGEVGLDYYHFEDCPTPEAIEKRKAVQWTIFEEMLDMAKQYNLPAIIHGREAFEDTYTTLKAADQPAVIHCFTGTAEQAKAWLDIGCMISVTGIITYKKNQELRDIIKEIPLTSLMIETDAPYLAPEGFRSKTCEPMFVRNVAECLAEIKGISFEEVNDITTENAEQFFGL